MLQNAYFLAKIGADTAENERNSADILPKIGNYPTGPLPAAGPRCPAGRVGAVAPVAAQRGAGGGDAHAAPGPELAARPPFV